MSDDVVILEAPADEHDAILLERVAPWAASGPVSFLRANKPDWRLEVVRHSGRLEADEADAVADSALALELLRCEGEGRPVSPRRELVLTAMEQIARRLELTDDERRAWHYNGYAWALRLGRWDDAGIAALEGRFEALRAGIDALLSGDVDSRIAARWSLVSRPAGTSADAVAAASKLLSLHANRLGVFAEAEAILHFLMFRRAGGTHAPVSA